LISLKNEKEVAQWSQWSQYFRDILFVFEE
jgi:hypothetical protein